MMSFSIGSDELRVAMNYQNIGAAISIDERWNSIFNHTDVIEDKITSLEQKIFKNINSSSTIEDNFDSDQDDLAPTLIIVPEPEETIIPEPVVSRVSVPYTGRIEADRLSQLQSLLDCIRIKPEAFNDIRETTYLNDNEVQLCDASHTGTIIEASTSSYGSSSKSHTHKIRHSKSENNTGKTYGQDYIYADINSIFELDGHGSDGELYSAFAGMRFPYYTKHRDIDLLLTSENYTGVIDYIQMVFSKIEDDILKCNTQPFDINRITDPGFLTDILKNRSINNAGGTTANYCSLHNITSVSGVKKRFIVAANIGDSETYAVMRFPDSSRKIKVLSATHSVENTEEASRIIKLHKQHVKPVMPIYSRFNIYNIYGNAVSPFPKEVIPHIDHINAADPFPIYDIMDDESIKVNGETLHKLQMGLGKYGSMYNINEWYGGIQCLRSHVIEKKIEGTWKSIAPIPCGDPANFGSTPNGNTQTTRAFGDLLHSEYISAKPHVCILQVPDDAHLTIISSSDGYSDVVYLSQVADEISKVPYGTIDCAKKLKANLTRLMQDNIIDKAINGYTMNNMLQPMWDDVSFGIIDSPPYQR